jgi:hypothetical protein
MSNIDSQPIHPLRQRMIEDMTLRGISPGTQKHYVRAVRACCAYLGVRPDDLTGDLARSYLLHLQGTGVGYVTEQWSSGCRNGAELWRRVKAQGYSGCRLLL